MTASRKTALNWLLQVLDGRSVNEILSVPPKNLEPKDIAYAKHLLFGSLRYFHQLKTLTDNLLDKPLKTKDHDVLGIILLGLYQLKYMSTPDHAAISESVSLTKQIKKDWAKGLINAILRRYQREQNELAEQLAKSLQYQFSHPGWIVKQLKADWENHWQSILQANNQQAPMVLRVNRHKISSTDYLSLLKQQNINATKHELAENGIVLDSACDVASLPGFAQGLVTVQDASPQLVIELMQLKGEENLNILDACAAPGGKTGHIIQAAPTAKVTALEISANRAKKISQTMQRMGFECEVKVADFLGDSCTQELNAQYDRILLDVPCSATGVIRRNPDIKIHRKVTDIKALVKIQAQMIAKAWQMLKPNGILVYATCSIFKQENESQLLSFCEQLAQTDYEWIELPKQIADKLNNKAKVGYQIFPGEYQMDGFYLSALRKLVS